jgi:hypothetical protein
MGGVSGFESLKAALDSSRSRFRESGEGKRKSLGLISSMAKISRGSRAVSGCDLYVNYERGHHHFAHIHARRGEAEVALFDFSGRLIAKGSGVPSRQARDIGRWIGDHHRDIIRVWRKLFDSAEPRQDGMRW